MAFTPITALPTPPNRSMAQEVFTPTADTFLAALPTMVTQANALGADANDNATAAATKAAEALASASGAQAAQAAAAASANYKGLWTALAGALAIPATTYHLGSYWNLTESVANVAAEVPGTSAKWTRVMFGDGQTLALPQTLTTSAASTIVLTSTGHGKALTLPPAGACLKGEFGRYTNSSRYDVPIRNTAGTLLGFIPPKSSVVVSLVDNSTSAGVWTLGDAVSYFGATGGGTLTPVGNLNATAVSNYLRVVNIDASRDLVMWSDGTRLSGAVYDAATQTLGAAVAIRVAAVAGVFNGLTIAANTVLVASWASASAMQAVVLSLSGTTITVNTATATTLTNSGTSFEILAVGSSYCFATYTGTVSNIAAMTVAGTTVTIGSALNLAGDTEAQIFVSGSSLMTFAHESGSGFITARSYTVAGTTFTGGTAATWGAASAWAVRPLNSGRWALAAASVGAIASLAGTVATISTVALGLGSSFNSVHVVGNQMVVVGTPAGNMVNILTDNAGVAVAGTPVSLGTVAHGFLMPLGGSATEMWLLGYTVVTGSSVPIRAYAISASGNNPVVTASGEHMTSDDTGATVVAVHSGKRAFDQVWSGTWGVLMPSASTIAPEAFYFDGQVLRRGLRPPFAVGLTNDTSPRNIYAYAANWGVTQSTRWVVQQETATSFRVLKLEAA